MTSIVQNYKCYKFTVIQYLHVSFCHVENLWSLITFTSSQDKNYDFIITGHSLGAGVGAVLAVLYRKELPSHQKLHCYAFSPPGSLFTLPLVEYSKSFITTIVYGNDIVPRFEIQ